MDRESLGAPSHRLTKKIASARQSRSAVHEPQPFETALCRRFGLMPRSSRFYDFRTPGLVRFWPRAAVAIGRAFETVGDRGWLAWWGSGYLVRLEKARAE